MNESRRDAVPLNIAQERSHAAFNGILVIPGMLSVRADDAHLGNADVNESLIDHIAHLAQAAGSSNPCKRSVDHLQPGLVRWLNTVT